MGKALNPESPIRFVPGIEHKYPSHINGTYLSRLFLHGYLMALGIKNTKPDPKIRAIYIEGVDDTILVELVNAYNRHINGNDEPLKIFGKEHTRWM